MNVLYFCNYHLLSLFSITYSYKNQYVNMYYKVQIKKIVIEKLRYKN